MKARARFVGLLDEPLDPPHTGIEFQRHARMNVAIARGGMVGVAPKVTISPALAAAVGLGAEPRELLSVLEHMVGGEHGDNCLRIARGRPSRCGADSGGAITPVRLEQCGRLGSDLPQLRSDAK